MGAMQYDSRERYIYSLLSQSKPPIRLLTVTRTISFRHFSLETDFDISLGHFDLDEVPPYLALSYKWGEKYPLQYVSIRGERPFELEITENLYNFLKQVVRGQNDEPQYLFIDQICINQTSMSERSQQVALMSRIYAKSRKVIVWLGAV
jgi:Heterokaryon incompatibility protein (HET)